MSDLFKKISQAFSYFKREKRGTERAEKRCAPRFICSVPVLWETARQSGEGELREISATGLRLSSERAVLAGEIVRVRPRSQDGEVVPTIDVAIGSVIYSRWRAGRYEVGIELINPERLSRFAWIGRLVRGEVTLGPSLSKRPLGRPIGVPHLRIVNSRLDDNSGCSEKNSKK